MPDPDKVAALKVAGPPQSAAEVRSILFFADFIEGFAQATAPLRELLKLNAKFQCLSGYQRSFKRIQEMLTDETVRAYFRSPYFDPGRKTRLKTDAGPGGMAATMKQYDPEAKR